MWESSEILATLLYDKPGSFWTREKRIKLVEILTWEDTTEPNEWGQLEIDFDQDENNPIPLETIRLLDPKSTINLHKAVPELSIFFSRIASNEFIQGANNIKQLAQKNILASFNESPKSKEAPEKFQEIVSSARDIFSAKISKLVSNQEFIYFFKYSRISFDINNNDKYTICIHISVSEAEKAKDVLPYVAEKFDAEFLVLFDEIIKLELGSKKAYREYSFWLSEEHYNERKRDIGEKEYNHFLKCENAGYKESKKKYIINDQLDIFFPATKFIEHSWNTQGFKIFNDRYQSQVNIHRKNASPGILLWSEDNKKEIQSLLNHCTKKLEKNLPFLDIQIIEWEEFIANCLEKYNKADDAMKREALIWRIQNRYNGNIFIIKNFEKLEHSTFIQNILLSSIMKNPNNKFILISDKNPTRFRIANWTVRFNKDKTPMVIKWKEIMKYEKTWIIPEMLEKIQWFYTTKVSGPTEKESGNILYEVVKERYPEIDLNKNLIKWIGRLLPHSDIYGQLAAEIGLAHSDGEKFSLEKAKEIIENHIGEVYQLTLQDIDIAVEDYILEKKEENRRQEKDIQKIRIWLIAYLSQDTRLPGRKRREKSTVATYLNTKQSNINSYIRKWFDYTYDLWEIRKIIEKTKEYKENSCFNFFTK